MTRTGLVLMLVGAMLTVAGCQRAETDRSDTPPTQTESSEPTSTQPPADDVSKQPPGEVSQQDQQAEKDGTVTGALGRALLKGVTGQDAEKPEDPGQADPF